MDNIEVRVHKEIREYREKYYGFTARQIVSAIIVLIIVIPSYIYLSPIFGQQVAMTVASIPSIPVVLIGWIPYQGLDFEKIFQFIWRNFMELSKPLKYESDAHLKARQYYYSHLPKIMSFRMNINSKVKQTVDTYFERICPTLEEEIRNGTPPKVIRPKRMTREELAAFKKQQRREKARLEKQRREQEIIKERTDRKKQAIDDNIVNRKDDHEKKDAMTDEEKNQLLAAMFDNDNSDSEEEPISIGKE